VQAFPLLFPYGYSGLPTDPAVVAAKNESENKESDPGFHKNRSDFVRSKKHVLKKFLQHSSPKFHGPMPNLIFHNTLLKMNVFEKSKIYCNTRMNDFQKYSEKFGVMDPDKLLGAINNFRKKSSARFSSKEEDFFIRSIMAICKKMPHTNEAARDAAEIYFSYVVKFGLPAIFLTITPDDNRNYRIVLYSMERKEYSFSENTVPNLSENDVIDEITFRSNVRQNYPGLCAEEYKRIMDAVISHFFGWDVKTGKAKDSIGFFGKPLAWLVATEEQGRKSLHGHILLFIKDWQRILNVIHRDRDEEGNQFRELEVCNRFREILTKDEAKRKAKQFFRNACTCNLLKDFQPAAGILRDYCTPFEHQCYGRRTERVKKSMRFTPENVDHQTIRDMRHRHKWKNHRGKIASCPNDKCQYEFRIMPFVEDVLKSTVDSNILFEDTNKKRLDCHVYHMNKMPYIPTIHRYTTADKEFHAKRYLCGNALANVHCVPHTKRCFKGDRQECYANLPAVTQESDEIHTAQEKDIWYNCKGEAEERLMFELKPQRSTEDIFMNTHNKELTILLGCNTNVLVGMNGHAVLYVTAYNTKGNQKEEREPFERVAKVLVDKLKKNLTEPNENDPSRKGFNNLLCAIFAHASAFVCAAPMSHFLALEESRFRYSYDNVYIGYTAIERYMKDEPMIQRLKTKNGKTVAFHKGMDYMFRPSECEDLCLYEFHERLEILTKYEAKKRKVEIWYELHDKHPFKEKNVVVGFRENEAVPIISWNWVGSTRKFKTPITCEVSDHDEDYDTKETYAMKFMILFLPS